MIRSSERRSALCRTRITALACLVFVSLVGGPSRADEAPPATDPRAMAREQGKEGLRLQSEGRFREAHERFATAEKLAHSPVFVLWMARTRRAMGELLAARKLYQTVVAERLPDDASPNWKEAQRDAVAELEQLSRRMPTLVVRVEGGASATVTIDGRAHAVNEPVELDAGPHEVRARVPGRPEEVARVVLEEGRNEEVQINLAAPPGPGRDAAEEGSLVPGAVVLGVGLTGLALGTATGVSALVIAGDVESSCVDDHCLVEDETRAGTADTLARVSTGAFIAGGVVAAVGVILLVVRPGGGDAAVSIGPRNVGFTARF